MIGPPRFRTRWTGAIGRALDPGAQNGRAPAQGRSAEPLAHLARQSLQRGHWRVALRRMLMMQCLQAPLPDDLDRELRRLLPAVSVSQRSRMMQAAAQWEAMLRVR